MGQVFLFLLICGMFYGFHWLISRFFGQRASYLILLGLSVALMLLGMVIPLGYVVLVPLSLSVLFFAALVACWHKRELDERKRDIAGRFPERAQRIPGYSEMSEDWFNLMLVIVSLIAFMVCLAVMVMILPFSGMIMGSGGSAAP